MTDRKPAVLVVEDEPLILMTTIDAFEEAGFEAIDALNGEQALQRLDERPDIRAIFTDVNMPGLYDGVELACWGDHFEVAKADQAYCDNRRAQLDAHGLHCHAISAHLVGQAVCDLIDERHKTILPDYVYGDGDPEGVRRRAAGISQTDRGLGWFLA